MNSSFFVIYKNTVISQIPTTPNMPKKPTIKAFNGFTASVAILKTFKRTKTTAPIAVLTRRRIIPFVLKENIHPRITSSKTPEIKLKIISRIVT